MSYSKEAVARNLKVERVKHGWSQEELAEAAGMNVGNVARYEAGINTPGLDTALKLAQALGVSIDALVGWRPPEAA